MRLRYRVQLRLHLRCACTALVGEQNNSFKGGPDAVLEGALHDELNFAFEVAL